jgi:HEPN domain-containing protein
MRDRDVNKLLRAARQRLTSATILRNQAMYLDSMYIAGYAPECALKALILANVVGRQRAAYQREHFRGAIAHDFEYLRALLRRRRVQIPLHVARSLRRIASWSTNLRYEVGLKRAAEADQFLAAAREIVEWVERSLV